MRIFFPQTNTTYALQERFELKRRANAGDPSAMLQLGLRYLVGYAMEADTTQAFYWIHRSAMTGHVGARFNLGVFYHYGWRAPWNPFVAYEHFLYAAERDMPIAQYAVGVAYAENLVVPKDLEVAYYWLEKAKAGGYEQAQNALDHLHKQGVTSGAPPEARSDDATDERGRESRADPASKVKLAYIDYSERTPREVGDAEVVKDAEEELDVPLAEIVREGNDDRLDSAIARLEAAAAVGSPEALTALGRFSETGTGVERDPLKAAEYYLRAYRLGSTTAPFLLWDLKEAPAFMRLVRNGSVADDPLAKYVYAGLASAGFVGGIDGQMALGFFESAGDRAHAPSLIALGAAYYTGGAGARDRDRALDYWRRAQALGSEEAAVRILVAETIEGYPPLPNDELIAELERLEKRGAILAEIALGYCREFGVGKPIDKAAAAERYQRAAARGSNVAFEYLKKLYDEVRPNDERFHITE